MGTATILENYGAGKYKISIDLGSLNRTATIDYLNSSINSTTNKINLIYVKMQALQAQYDALSWFQIEERNKTNYAYIKLETQYKYLKIKRAQEIKKLDRYQSVSGVITLTTWCVDYSLSLTGTVSTLEIPNDPQNIVIAPGGNARPTIASGALKSRYLIDPNQLYWNVAALPGWQIFYPTYRIAKVDKVRDNGTVDVTLTTAESKHLSTTYNLNQRTSMTEVPVDYMSCNTAVFSVGDYCVVEFQGFNWNNPLVIGFPDNPKPPPSIKILFAMSYINESAQTIKKYISNTEFFLGNTSTTGWQVTDNPASEFDLSVCPYNILRRYSGPGTELYVAHRKAVFEENVAADRYANSVQIFSKTTNLLRTVTFAAAGVYGRYVLTAAAKYHQGAWYVFVATVWFDATNESTCEIWIHNLTANTTTTAYSYLLSPGDYYLFPNENYNSSEFNRSCTELRIGKVLGFVGGATQYVYDAFSIDGITVTQTATAVALGDTSKVVLFGYRADNFVTYEFVKEGSGSSLGSGVSSYNVTWQHGSVKSYVPTGYNGYGLPDTTGKIVGNFLIAGVNVSRGVYVIQSTQDADWYYIGDLPFCTWNLKLKKNDTLMLARTKSAVAPGDPAISSSWYLEFPDNRYLETRTVNYLNFGSISYFQPGYETNLSGLAGILSLFTNFPRIRGFALYQ